jgi:zinc transporter 1/2/3
VTGWEHVSLAHSLLDPAYDEIGPNTCVGMTGNWAVCSWPPAIVLVSVMFIFLLDFCAERMVAKKCGLAHGPVCSREAEDGGGEGAGTGSGIGACHAADDSHLHSGDQDEIETTVAQKEDLESTSPADDSPFHYTRGRGEGGGSSDTLAYEKVAAAAEVERDRLFRQQISAFLILEFGIIFHSVIIGLTLGTAGDEFSTLYPVIVIHQTFEGLGIGARLSGIPIPRSWGWLPWFLCAAYGLTTPVAMAIGLGMRYTYNGNSYAANIVSGVLDSISAGVLIYTGLLELLARDFLFNAKRMNDSSGRLAFMIGFTLLGALMALLRKWA